jgi:hypothetical protein
VKRFLIGYPVEDERNPGDGDYDIVQLRTGLQLAQVLSKDLQTPIWIVTETKKTLMPVSELTRAYGDPFVKSLASRGNAQLEGRTIYLGTPGSHSWPPKGVVLVIYPDDALMDRLHRLPGIIVEVVVPWRSSGVEHWIDTWGVRQILGKEAIDLPKREIGDPDVLEATENALSMSGLSHPSDVERARKSFAALRRRNKNIDHRAIRAHALRTTGHGVSAADRLVKIAIGRNAKDR